MEFNADTYQNEYLPIGGTVVDAIVTISATGEAMASTVGSHGGPPSDAAVVIVLDMSGSMHPRPRSAPPAQAAVSRDRVTA